MPIDVVLPYLEAGSYVVTIAGFPLALTLYIREKRKDRWEREQRAFDELDDKYIQFMQLCLEHPEVDVSEVPLEGRESLTCEQLRAEHALFAILISLFERAFVMFEDQDSDYRERQWGGWEKLIRSYTVRSNFRRVWAEIGSQFDSRFQRFMADLTDRVKDCAVDPPTMSKPEPCGEK